MESPTNGNHKSPDNEERLSPDHQQILVNLVKVKDQEIKDLKNQLNNASLEQDSPGRRETHSANASPLRPSAKASQKKHNQSPL